jgi:hypothetical protein
MILSKSLLTPTTHRLSFPTSFIPHMSVPPGSIHLHKHSPLVLHLPLWVSTTGRIKNSQSFVAGVGLFLGENYFPADSLTWRELLTGMTICLFYHGLDNPILQLNSHKFKITTTTTFG